MSLGPRMSLQLTESFANDAFLFIVAWNHPGISHVSFALLRRPDRHLVTMEERQAAVGGHVDEASERTNHEDSDDKVIRVHKQEWPESHEDDGCGERSW